MKICPQILFADRLPPLVGGVEMHADAFIEYFKGHPIYPLDAVVETSWKDIESIRAPSILFFNGGRWIEEMPLIRRRYPCLTIVYRTGGNEIIKAPLNRFSDSHQMRQNFWIENLNSTVDHMITNSAFTESRLRNLGLIIPFVRCVGGVGSVSSTPKQTRTSKALLFFSAARFVPYKNHLLLIAAFNELYRRGKEFSLVLAGDGPLFEEAQTAARDNPQITFLGRCSNHEILQQMVNADVYIQLSSDFETKVPGGKYNHTEGMGRSILEAISVGTYVVAGDCSAFEEIVTKERGELISPNSLSKVVGALEGILNSPPKKGAPTDQFEWKYVFKRYESLYESLNHH